MCAYPQPLYVLMALFLHICAILTFNLTNSWLCGCNKEKKNEFTLRALHVYPQTHACTNSLLSPICTNWSLFSLNMNIRLCAHTTPHVQAHLTPVAMPTTCHILEPFCCIRMKKREIFFSQAMWCHRNHSKKSALQNTTILFFLLNTWSLCSAKSVAKIVERITKRKQLVLISYFTWKQERKDLARSQMDLVKSFGGKSCQHHDSVSSILKWETLKKKKVEKEWKCKKSTTRMKVTERKKKKWSSGSRWGRWLLIT